MHAESAESQLKGARALVTGGLGFIGSRLALRLASLGAHVTVVDSMVPDTGANDYHAQLLQGRAVVRMADVRDEDAVSAALTGQDFLFNLAALVSHMDSMREPFDDLDVNARAQLTILDSIRQVNPGIRVLHASTRQVYGRARSLPVNEDHPLRPPDVNGINKLAGEGFFQLYHDVYGVRGTVLRLTNTYGPGMRIRDGRQTFLGIWLSSVLEGTRFAVWGGSQVRDLLFVEDVVDAFIAAACTDSCVGQAYNVGRADGISLRDLAELLTHVHGGGTYDVVPYPDDRRPIEIGDFVTDARKFAAATGWRARVELQDGLRRTLAYYDEQRANYL
ncbi:NAD-dependent epimerase/dehydratase family protein [soil metagenome]